MAFEQNSPALWQRYIKSKAPERHKYDYGHVAVLGGAEMTGAASFAASAALRMGAGLATIFSPPKVAQVYRQFCPSIIVREIDSYQNFSEALSEKQNAVVIGPGAGLEDKNGLKQSILNILTFDKFTVLDADALNVFAGDTETLLKALHNKCVLTPHDGEFSRLFPEITGEKQACAKKAAEMSGCTVLLKGHETYIAHPDGRLVMNDNGTGWLATAGTGDVLSGMVAGLSAQKDYPLFEAVCIAVWFQGRAAQLAGPGMISSDLAKFLPQVWQEILN